MARKPTADATWTSVNYLRITSARYLDSAKVFGNSNQQCEIIVGIGLLNGNSNVDITPEQAKSLINIINYTTQQPIPIVEDPKASTNAWVVSHNSMGFQWDEDVIGRVDEKETQIVSTKQKHAKPSAYIQEVKILVSTSLTSGTIKLAASVHHPTLERSWNTAHAGVDDPDGYGKGGQFNSSVTVLSRQLHQPRPSDPDFGHTEPGYNRLVRQSISTMHLSEDGTSWSKSQEHNAPHAGALYEFYESWITISYGGKETSIHSVTLGDNTKIWSANGIGKDNSEWCAAFITTVHQSGGQYVVGDQGAYQLRHRIQGILLKTLSACVNDFTGGRITYSKPSRVVIGILNGTDDNVFVDKSGNLLADAKNQRLTFIDAFGTTHEVNLTIEDNNYIGVS